MAAVSQEKLIDIGLPGDGGIVILPQEGEEDGGLIDIDLPLLDLPLPILGADAFEPDNTPELAIWRGLQNLLEGLNLIKDTHNFHVSGDEDWSKFQAVRGSVVTVETKDVRSLADTFIRVYRLASESEPLPTQGPAGCGPAWLEGPKGERLFLIGCNDDVGGTGPQARRSKVEFTVPETGLYYARITLSPKAAQQKGLDPNAGETTYNFQAYSQGSFASTLYCTLLDAGTGNAVNGAQVVLNPYAAPGNPGGDGVYTVNGVYQGVYTLVATKAGYDVVQEPVVISQQGGAAVTVYMEAVTEGEGGPDGTPPAPTPSFDFSAPAGHVDLAEVLRAVQLYNARSYHCDGGAEDKYAPFPGSLQCAPHPLDYIVQDWTIDLSELLRLLQLFSIGEYTPCEGGEAGACP